MTDAHESVGLFTIAGTQHGPYPGAVTGETSPYDSIAFDRATVDQLMDDINRDNSPFRAAWEDPVLRFSWTTDAADGVASAHIRPDPHGRYRIGGLWPWADWDDWDDEAAPCSPKYAFALGVVEFCFTRTTPMPDHLLEPYNRGREAAHHVTLYQYAV
ncbi:hypothetical protein QMK19_38335 [Streptomyces sp. H10-C2]|uniref:hypothetical protein n=1 Tax=unclassified Streptomyces TaxID=2593676 RepID=UPI0024B8CFAD|nr:MULTISPECIES: hypothetical protein [unclassified Streptomyces]MDJ0347036.1 hypothetical protein [Streptomyces sp. PH10-H1]MDJ0375304.1 hypothetical protein [Streptomyces sp. H10-C2]